MAGPDAVAVRRTEATDDPRVPHSGLEHRDAALQFLLFIAGNVRTAVSAAAAAAARSYKLADELFDLGVLRVGHGGDFREGALHHLVSVRRSGHEVVKMRVKIRRDTDAGHADVGEAKNGLAMRGVGDVVSGLGGSRGAKCIFALRDARLALEVLLEGFEITLPRRPRLIRPGFAVPGRAIVGKRICEGGGGRGEGGEPFVRNREFGVGSFPLRFFHAHYVLGYAGVSRPEC